MTTTMDEDEEKNTTDGSNSDFNDDGEDELTFPPKDALDLRCLLTSWGRHGAPEGVNLLVAGGSR